MRATEFITEYRDRMYQYIKSLVPTWPDYVVRDWLYANFARGNVQTNNYSFATLGKDLPGILADTGLSADTKWQLVPNMKFTMDMWEPKTLKRLQARAGGSSHSTDPEVHIPARDAERHATQAALAQQQGGVRKEPVIIIKRPNGYELMEGWHRTIQHFKQYPNGYTGPAYVAVARQGVSEGFSNDMSTEDMIEYLRQHHDRNLHPDYLGHLTNTNSKFVLKNIPLTAIRTELAGLDRAKVEQYKKMDFSKAPPIVVGSDGNILDGYHRANVAKALGIPTIKAYVGVKGQQDVSEDRIKESKTMEVVVIGPNRRLEKRRIRIDPTTRDPVDAIIRYYARLGREVFGIEGRPVDRTKAVAENRS